MKKAFLFAAIFAFFSAFAIQFTAPSRQVEPSPDSKSSTSPLNAPSLTDPSAKPITPPTPPATPPKPTPTLTPNKP